MSNMQKRLNTFGFIYPTIIIIMAAFLHNDHSHLQTASCMPLG